MKFTKKMLASILLLVFAFFSLSAMVSSNNEIVVTIDGERVIFENQGPVILNGRTLVPVRDIFEILGFEPIWDSVTQTATLIRDDYVVILTIGSYNFITNGVSHALDVPAQLIAGRTLLPLRAILESVGYDDIDWDPVTRTVSIRTGTIEQPISTPIPTLFPNQTMIYGLQITVLNAYVFQTGARVYLSVQDESGRNRPIDRLFFINGSQRFFITHAKRMKPYPTRKA